MRHSRNTHEQNRRIGDTCTIAAGWLAGNPAAAAEPEYVTGKPMVSEKEKRAAVS